MPGCIAAADDVPTGRREIQVVGFLGISDYGLGQLEVLIQRYRVAFATAKRQRAAHAQSLDGRLADLCSVHGIEYLGSVDANAPEVVARARDTDLVVIGGYDAILRRPILEAPRHGVVNTHLGVLPLNRGCCPTMWAQLHDLPQGYTTYRVGVEIDFGDILDSYTADDALGGCRDVNRQVYDALSSEAVARFGAALDRFESGASLSLCAGQEAYHRKGMPNDGWLSFHWGDAFLRRFSLALDFAPYLPGRARVQGDGSVESEISISVEAPCLLPDARQGPVGEVLESADGALTVRTREGAVRCRLRAGPLPSPGSVLSSGRPADEGSRLTCRHPIDDTFAGDVLPVAPYLCDRPDAQG